MELLNQVDSALRTPEKRAFAVATLLETSLRRARCFVMQCDYPRLARVIGVGLLRQLVPSFDRVRWREHEGALEVCEAPIDSSTSAAVRAVLATDQGAYPELPLIHIESVALLDRAGRLILYGNDANENLLFSLSDTERKDLVDTYATRGIPADVIEPIASSKEDLLCKLRKAT